MHLRNKVRSPFAYATFCNERVDAPFTKEVATDGRRHVLTRIPKTDSAVQAIRHAARHGPRRGGVPGRGRHARLTRKRPCHAKRFEGRRRRQSKGGAAQRGGTRSQYRTVFSDIVGYPFGRNKHDRIAGRRVSGVSRVYDGERRQYLGLEKDPAETEETGDGGRVSLSIAASVTVEARKCNRLASLPRSEGIGEGDAYWRRPTSGGSSPSMTDGFPVTSFKSSTWGGMDG